MINDERDLLNYIIELIKNELENIQRTQNNLITYLTILYAAIIGFVTAQSFTPTITNFLTGVIQPFSQFGPIITTIVLFCAVVIILLIILVGPTAINKIVQKKDYDRENLHKILQAATKYKYNWEIISLENKKIFLKSVKDEFAKHDALKDIKVQYGKI